VFFFHGPSLDSMACEWCSCWVAKGSSITTAPCFGLTANRCYTSSSGRVMIPFQRSPLLGSESEEAQCWECHFSNKLRIHPQKSIFLLSIFSCVQAVAPTERTHLQLLVRCGSTRMDSKRERGPHRRGPPRVCRAQALSAHLEKTAGGRPHAIAVKEQHAGNQRCGQDGQAKLQEQGLRGRREGEARAREETRRKADSQGQPVFFRGLLWVLLERKQCPSTPFFVLACGVEYESC
jgi:hypothetical protein